ncbi:uncharacterized protein LOC101845728 [Aplysia californica]|uniref:Uncharacterized protein LOC101845728 n=1 Tax=Aplysia californica TaxID=6500 RepID=A0ABM0K6I4_APLCA|nr:uncharacterized protein LOC101845728 [Aplysia californica]
MKISLLALALTAFVGANALYSVPSECPQTSSVRATDCPGEPCDGITACGDGELCCFTDCDTTVCTQVTASCTVGTRTVSHGQMDEEQQCLEDDECGFCICNNGNFDKLPCYDAGVAGEYPIAI